VDLSNLDVHTVAGVVTLFFNKLPNPLLTTELYDCFITAIGTALVPHACVCARSTDARV
jgi:hypothetical protein